MLRHRKYNIEYYPLTPEELMDLKHGQSVAMAAYINDAFRRLAECQFLLSATERNCVPEELKNSYPENDYEGV